MLLSNHSEELFWKQVPNNEIFFTSLMYTDTESKDITKLLITRTQLLIKQECPKEKLPGGGREGKSDNFAVCSAQIRKFHRPAAGRG